MHRPHLDLTALERDEKMSDLEQLSRNLFERADATITTNFKVFLGKDREVRVEDVCAEINKIFAQEKAGCLQLSSTVDGHIKTIPADSIFSA